MSRMPLKARLGLWHQHTILFVRWCFRIRSDDLRDLQIENLLDSNRQLAEGLKLQAALSNQLHQRLSRYETKIPSIRKEFLLLAAEQKKAREKALSARFDELVAAGVPELEAREAVWPTPKEEPSE